MHGIFSIPISISTPRHIISRPKTLIPLPATKSSPKLCPRHHHKLVADLQAKKEAHSPESAVRTWRDGPTSAAGAAASPIAAAAAAAAAPLPVVLPKGRPRFAGVEPPPPPDLPAGADLTWDMVRISAESQIIFGNKSLLVAKRN